MASDRTRPGSTGRLTAGAVPSALLPHVRRARDLIDRQYARPISLDELAAEAGLSKYHFLRCFAAAYGQTPGVEFVAEPADRPYGVEAIAVDPSGNKLVVVEQHLYRGEDFPHS